MALSRKLRAIGNALRVQGVGGFVAVMLEKRRKQERYAKMLNDVPASAHTATLNPRTLPTISVDPATREQIIRSADAMISDDNRYFTFRYSLRGVPRPWNYDPYEKAWWPERHYTEQKLHDDDTPSDVKIVWEINRFKDLPTLAQAVYLTRDKRYADEIDRRLLSWIGDNPFANTINWASGLELGIRLLSWTVVLELCRASGFDLSTNARIARAIYEQVAYLRAELSTDKIVRSNHLIGEAAALLTVSKLWAFPESKEFAAAARSLLESEIIRQTYDDGATREATTWYHGFVTDFFDIASRVSSASGKPLSKHFSDRLRAMKIFRESTIQPDGTPVRIGDADDGYALYLEGSRDAWWQALWGIERERTFRIPGFAISGYATLSDGSNAMFVRGGEFGMGGNGSSSHAHDDLLAPVVWLNGLPILVDPGTFVYNGAAKYRSRYRGEHHHNTFSLDDGSEAKQKLNFGWYETRRPARIAFMDQVPGDVEGSYGEWPEHTRKIRLGDGNAEILDEVIRDRRRASGRLHLHPMWKPVQETGLAFVNERGDLLLFEIEGWKRIDIESYDYSPSYRVQVPASKIILQTGPVRGKFAVRFRIEPAA